MGKTNRRHRDDDDDEARLRALEQKALHGRLPTAPPGHVHDTDRDREKNRSGRKRSRNRERRELRELADDYNRGRR